eukprot:SAG25_NODE_11477_length_303_cov_0.906863_1_plen_40_part_01
MLHVVHGVVVSLSRSAWPFAQAKHATAPTGPVFGFGFVGL